MSRSVKNSSRETIQFTIRIISQILKHPSVRLTTDGQADPYIHGVPWDAGSSIELVYDPEQIAMTTATSAQMPELIEADYVLLSEEDVERSLLNIIEH